jgi:hypothetical protein
LDYYFALWLMFVTRQLPRTKISAPLRQRTFLVHVWFISWIN